ncbi:transmembrane ascorbate ferrireductase 2-like isoform X2 [Salvia miltiorrhiza]|uniref:transmembrane ascorbate ferrireductase 2-like isoform X2 n=1 Tax=Salvia miltiorrhiza TaxID=226208 RepID=UPI0025AC724E|nr:transmembrane ascorbate ferrireductase 2-like isoform X2 [Salvia miltiorrhiza]
MHICDIYICSMATNRYSSHQAAAAMLAHLVAAALITLVLVWLLHFRGGLAFKSDNKAKIFNLHPLLMIIGFVLFSGEAMMAYKTVPANRKRQKVFHLVVHLIALLAGILGVYAVFDYHKQSKIIHLYTLHSWLGITTISLFAFQWVVSLLTFWYPGAQESAKGRLSRWHVVVGVPIFAMMILSAETGVVEKFIFLGLRRNQEALILNLIGLFIFIFALSVALTLALPRYNS